MKKLIVIAVCLLTGCMTDEGNSQRTLENAGYTDVHFTGYSYFSCGDDDAFATGFTATNPAGKRVSGTVCCGWLTKGCTIRY